MLCPHPDCTGVHDNNRFAELCPRSLDRKRARDLDYHSSWKGALKRSRANVARNAAALGAAIGRPDLTRAEAEKLPNNIGILILQRLLGQPDV
jgi:hypothetical protein